MRRYTWCDWHQFASNFHFFLFSNSPVYISGQYPDLLTIFTKCGLPPATNYLFLGDYVDRAHRSIECIMLLLCLKLKFPGRIFLLRGNHETASLNRVYGFFDECKRRYTVKLWRTFVDCFNCMPIAALVEDKIFCTHGGLSPSLTDFADINQIRRPLDVPPEGLMCDLLWSDPVQSDIEWTPSARYFCPLLFSLILVLLSIAV